MSSGDSKAGGTRAAIGYKFFNDNKPPKRKPAKLKMNSSLLKVVTTKKKRALETSHFRQCLKRNNDDLAKNLEAVKQQAKESNDTALFYQAENQELRSENIELRNELEYEKDHFSGDDGVQKQTPTTSHSDVVDELSEKENIESNDVMELIEPPLVLQQHDNSGEMSASGENVVIRNKPLMSIFELNRQNRLKKLKQESASNPLLSVVHSGVPTGVLAAASQDEAGPSSLDVLNTMANANIVEESILDDPIPFTGDDNESGAFRMDDLLEESYADRKSSHCGSRVFAKPPRSGRMSNLYLRNSEHGASIIPLSDVTSSTSSTNKVVDLAAVTEPRRCSVTTAPPRKSSVHSSVRSKTRRSSTVVVAPPPSVVESVVGSQCLTTEPDNNVALMSDDVVVPGNKSVETTVEQDREKDVTKAVATVRGSRVNARRSNAVQTFLKPAESEPAKAEETHSVIPPPTATNDCEQGRKGDKIPVVESVSSVGLLDRRGTFVVHKEKHVINTTTQKMAVEVLQNVDTVLNDAIVDVQNKSVHGEVPVAGKGNTVDGSVENHSTLVEKSFIKPSAKPIKIMSKAVTAGVDAKKKTTETSANRHNKPDPKVNVAGSVPGRRISSRVSTASMRKGASSLYPDFDETADAPPPARSKVQHTPVKPLPTPLRITNRRSSPVRTGHSPAIRPMCPEAKMAFYGGQNGESDVNLTNRLSNPMDISRIPESSSSDTLNETATLKAMLSAQNSPDVSIMVADAVSVPTVVVESPSRLAEPVAPVVAEVQPGNNKTLTPAALSLRLSEPLTLSPSISSEDRAEKNAEADSEEMDSSFIGQARSRRLNKRRNYRISTDDEDEATPTPQKQRVQKRNDKRQIKMTNQKALKKTFESQFGPVELPFDDESEPKDEIAVSVAELEKPTTSTFPRPTVSTVAKKGGRKPGKKKAEIEPTVPKGTKQLSNRQSIESVTSSQSRTSSINSLSGTGRPSRRAAAAVGTYQEISLNKKMRRAK